MEEIMAAAQTAGIDEEARDALRVELERATRDVELKLDPTNPHHLSAAREVLEAAADPFEPAALEQVQLNPIGLMRGYRVTALNQETVRRETGGTPFLDGRSAGPAECFYLITADGLQAEIAIGDVVVALDNGWWHVLAEDIDRLWSLSPVTGGR